jgi:aminoglycoside phosphotransferase (APT) family kinase protein
MVVLIGRSPEAAAEYHRVWRIGAVLGEQLGGLIPQPHWYAPPSDDFPQAALAYRKLAGETPRWGSDPGAPFARDLGAFMANLHGIDIDIARAAGAHDVDSYRRVLRARPVVTPILEARLAPASFARVEAWWVAFAGDTRMATRRLAACHHDLWHDNLLRSDTGRLSGVLDLAHVEVGDPAHDFAAPRYFGDAFMRELIAAYRDAGGRFGPNDAYRAERFFEARELGGLAWAIEHDDAAGIDDAIEKIRRGPLLASAPEPPQAGD